MTSVKLESISPIFTVHDLSQALEFYQHRLGFDLAWSWGTPPEIAAVCRDNVEITLAQRQDARPSGPSRVYLCVSDVDAYYVQIERAGVRIVVSIGDRSYGMRDFRVADADGNELNIGQAIAGGSGASR